MQERTPERLKDEAIVAQVRRRLEAEYGVALPAERAPVGRADDGTVRQHRFDLVAADGAIVGAVRTYTLGEGEGRRRPSGKFAHCYAECLFLDRARAGRKVLVLTDRAFWSRFRRESAGVVEGIEVIHVPVDEAALILTELPAEDAPAPAPPRRDRPPGPRGFERADEIPTPRRNRGGPGPRGRRPNRGRRPGPR